MKTVIIGLGPHGKRLLTVVRRMPALNLAGIVDMNPAAFEGVEGLDNSLHFRDTAAYYAAHPDTQMVIICTNGPSHAKLTLEAIDKGARYIMVEKPFACSVEECLTMEKAAKAKGVRLAVDQGNKQSPVYHYIRDNINSGAWGKLRNMYLQSPGIGLGCLSTHWVDLMNFFAGRDPLRVTGWVDTIKTKNPRGDQFVDPGGTVILDYGDELRGIVAQIEDGAGPMSLEIHTTAARIIYTQSQGELEIILRDLSVKPGPGRPPAYSKVQPPADLNLKSDMFQQIERVLTDLTGDKPMINDAASGTASIAIVAAAYISQAQGNIPVSLPLQKQEDISLYMPFT